MKFFDRNEEKQILEKVKSHSEENAQFTVLTGRRRVGKTWLITHTFNQEDMLYFFVARKSETDLCKGFVKEIEAKLHIPLLGSPEKFEDVFEYLMKYSQSHPITLLLINFKTLRESTSLFSAKCSEFGTYIKNILK